MYTQGGLERVALEHFRMGRQQLLENSQFQRQEALTKQVWLQLKQLLEHRLHRCKTVFGLGRLGLGINGAVPLGVLRCDRRSCFLSGVASRLGLILKGIGHGMNQIEQPVIVIQTAASLAYLHK